MGVELERDEQGRLRACGKRPSGESSLPVLERGGGNAFTRAEGGDRQATGGLPLEALPPGAFEVGVLGACHELAPGLVVGDQPARIAAVARLVLSSALPDVCSDETFLRRAFIDLIGLLPSPTQRERFLGDPAPDKRYRAWWTP